MSRVFCVGRNYADHVAEMGGNAERDPPIYFTKSAANALMSGAAAPYPSRTENFHHEVELVVAVGAPGRAVGVEEAWAMVFGLGVGLDMTRRDLQAAAKAKGDPWDFAKDFPGAVVFGPLTRAHDLARNDPAADDLSPNTLTSKRIGLTVNGQVRQDGRLGDMIWSVPEIIADLSTYTPLGPGDVILAGTPAGVGPVRPGDHLVGAVDGLAPVTATIGEPEAPA